MTLFMRARRPSGSRRSGAGEPVLLLHPYMLSHHSWRPVMTQLSRGHDVLAVSLPGHYGGPPLAWRGATLDHLVDHVERELDRVGWPTVHVVGNSLGGWVALELARRGRARSVTAIAPAGGYDGFSPRDLVMGAAFVATSLARPLLQLATLVPPRLLPSGALGAVVHQPGLLSRDDAHHIVRTAVGATHPLQVLVALIRSIPARDLESITVPVHLVFAEHDRVIPSATYSRYFLDRMPHARVTHLPGMGHCPQLEAPEVVADLVRDTIGLASPAAAAEAR